MAKSKRDSGSGASRTETPKEQIPPVERFSLVEYILIIVAFWCFCLASMAGLKLVVGDVLGLWFFFFTIGISFSFVAICHWVYDLIYRDETAEDSQ